jgi:GNAT superfamily N-acetyltransferase
MGEPDFPRSHREGKEGSWRRENRYKVHIREAIPEDNAELQKVQAQCPMGTTLVVSTVNTPDFFARAKAYASFNVFVACDENRIIGSAACAIREATVNGHLSRVGYEFQYFTLPEYRKKGIARQLHRHIEDHLTQRGALYAYLVIMEGNLPSMRLFAGEGFKLHRKLIMPVLPIYREMEVPAIGKIRSMVPEDLDSVSRLLNDTWQGYDLYEPASAEGLAGFINRTPGYRFDNVLILEDQGEILACLGFWDWRCIMRITVIERSLRMRIIGLLLGFMRAFRSMPGPIKAGKTLKQMMLTPIAFRNLRHLDVLLRCMNNQALTSGIEQIFCVSEADHPLLSCMKGFIRIDTGIYLYVKPLQQKVSMGNNPVFIDGIDL